MLILLIEKPHISVCTVGVDYTFLTVNLELYAVTSKDEQLGVFCKGCSAGVGVELT